MIGTQQCCCGYKNCRDYWLTGIGKFVQGSGFTKEQAEHIAKLLNDNPMPEADNGTATKTRSD
jgi:hypothetical protein